MVPCLKQDAEDNWVPETIPPRIVYGNTYDIQRYRPRIEGLFARIEKWINRDDPTDIFWRSISKDNITTWYGKTLDCRIVNDPASPSKIYSWLISESYDDKGNVIVYEYAREDSANIDISQVHEQNRKQEDREANCYLKRIKYRNRTPYFPILENNQP